MNHANPPSSRPMTLRQQLEQILEYNVGNEISDEDHVDITNDMLQLFERYCQEIAREARSDLAEAIVSNSIHTTGNKHSDSPNGTDTFTIDKTKLWELTHKPSKASNNPSFKENK